MTTVVKLGGRITVLTDAGPEEVDWIDFEDRVWIATLWFASHDQKWMKPIRIITPRFAPGMSIRLEAPHVEELFQKMPLPKALLERGATDSETSITVEVRESPDIVALNPSGPLH